MNEVRVTKMTKYCLFLTLFFSVAVVSYSEGDQIPQEAPHEIPETKPDESWPQEGAIEFDKIQMSYRPGLPNVLKGLSLSVKGGEKIGVVGR